MTAQLKAILFDLDDTLLDWSGFHQDWEHVHRDHLIGVLDYFRRAGHALEDTAAFEAAFRERTATAWEDAHVSLRAPHLGAVLFDAAAACGVPVKQLDMHDALRAYSWNAVEGTVIFPETREVITALRANGVRVGIVTNAYQPMWLRDVEMATHGILDLFPDCRLSAADVGYLKPHPAIFHAALECLGTQAEETVFVGDDPRADIAGAQASGLRGVLRSTPRTRPYVNTITPNAIIHDLRELFALLDGWYPGWRAAAAD